MNRIGALCIVALLAIGCRQVTVGGEGPHATIGPDSDTSGNYWGRGVSRQFQRPQLEALYRTMNAPSTEAEIRKLNCGKMLASHEYSVTLFEEGAYQERLVRLQMTPRLYSDDECLQEAVNYVFQRTVKATDPGPPIDYGYKDPHTGKPLDTSTIAESLPPQPQCSCTPAAK